MKIKQKTLYSIWFAITLVLTISMMLGLFLIKNSVDKKRAAENVQIVEKVKVVDKEVVQDIEKPVVQVVDVENIIDVNKEIYEYTFPFGAKDLGEFKVVGVTKSTMPSKEYPNFVDRSGVSAYASEDTLPEGSFIWIDGVGIRQISTAYGEKGFI